jgi:hypothetical protein
MSPNLDKPEMINAKAQSGKETVVFAFLCVLCIFASLR